MRKCASIVQLGQLVEQIRPCYNTTGICFGFRLTYHRRQVAPPVKVRRCFEWTLQHGGFLLAPGVLYFVNVSSGGIMDIVFTDGSLAGLAGSIHVTAHDQARLRLLLDNALAQATRLQKRVFASFTQPITSCDPLLIWQAFQKLAKGHNLFWFYPAERRALVGTGATAIIETQGPDCVGDAASIWREMQHSIITEQVEGTLPSAVSNGPLLFGGFAFDPLNPRTELWTDFPDGLLLLPRLLFSCDDQAAALTITLPVLPHDTVAQLESDIFTDLRQLQVELAQPLFIDDVQQPSTQYDMLAPSAWKQLVTEAVQHIHQGLYQKIVLARSVRIIAAQRPFSLTAVLHRLRESYPGAYVFAIQRGQRYFVGATPERLLCGIDGQLQTMALAGSAPRGTTVAEDQQLGEDLLHSAKNLEEHDVVVTTIREALTQLCSRVWVANAPHLLRLRNIQHLQTPIVGDLRPGHSILEAIEDLHPTPAVGGFPRLPTLSALRDHERLDRGWYAGPIGWVGTGGNGEFAVALRSALLDHQQATLFAGCGIVADSQAESEYAESCLKLQVMLRGLHCIE